MQDKTVIILAALFCATVVELAALLMGYDGYILAGFLAIIASVVGVPVGMIFQARRE